MKTPVSITYRQRSVAEQNSVDIAWGMLMSEQFTDLRECIYSSQEDLHRFRQLLVNATMATDIADKEFQQLRKNRWKDAFDNNDEENRVEQAMSPESSSNSKLEVHRKATIVLEHIIQAVRTFVAQARQLTVFCCWLSDKFEFISCTFVERRGAYDATLAHLSQVQQAVVRRTLSCLAQGCCRRE